MRRVSVMMASRRGAVERACASRAVCLGRGRGRLRLQLGLEPSGICGEVVEDVDEGRVGGIGAGDLYQRVNVRKSECGR